MQKIALLLLLFLLVGCAKPVRVTTEMFFNTPKGDFVVVKWPKGITKADLYNTDIDSQTLTVVKIKPL